ncbi:MAG: alpha-glucan family phosphorylase [Methanomicrobiales archaeon]|nr:alpha-glucan family phosphorylase [Methanomicrobiales archaeon]
MEAPLDHIKEQFFSHVPERISGLVDLSYNLWWSWTPEAMMLFRQLNVHAWIESVHNPVKMLQSIPPNFLEEAARRPQYLRHYDIVMDRFAREMNQKSTWFAEKVPSTTFLPIAYFSAEYGLHHSLPFYAGGLGFLAGDHIKECSDLGVPMVAVGFMYGEGYLHQYINADGWQEDIKETLTRDAAPVTRLMVKPGEQLVIHVPLMEPAMHVAVWEVAVGRIPLYLMDTDLDMNEPAHRSIFSRLYTGNLESRLQQELVLGIGGSEVLRYLGIEHSIVHLNEGHTAFTLLERVRQRVEEGSSFQNALQYVRDTSVFTTHTPVEAGHDRYPFSLIDRYFSSYYTELDLDKEGFLRLGADPMDPQNTFNMTALALRLSGHRNAVSREHERVAKRMWHPLWPDMEESRVPLEYITNGVHLPSWLAPKMELTLDEHLGRFYPRWLDDHDSTVLWELMHEVSDQSLWRAHQALKRQLFNRIREFKRWKWIQENAEPINVVAGGTLLDPNALTIGFARRFTSYKRADLLFTDTARLKNLLNNWWRPVQVIFAGKAHPDDYEGKRILQRIYRFACQPEFSGRIAFVEDYDEQIAQLLVHGVDVWLNTPVRGMEASGTSGMKAAMNGVLHLSIPTGWWPEGYNGRNGWVIGGDTPDDQDAQRLYEILERDVVPLYYSVSEDGTPHQWIQQMKESIRSISPRFSARRMVKEYVERYYIPALISCQESCSVEKSG